LKIVGDITKKVQVHLTTLGRNIFIVISLTAATSILRWGRYIVWSWSGWLYV